VQIMMTSNGGGLLGDIPEKIRALFAAGLDILALDEYQDVKIVSKIRAQMDKMTDILFIEYPTDPDGNPHRRYARADLPFVSLMADPSRVKSSKTPSLTNHCGAAFPKNEAQAGKRCHRPFRELSVRWDGSVAVCCNDWRGEYKCGNINEIGMEAVWQSAAMDAARRKLYRGERDFGPCAGCDARSYRVGLLPDKMGKDSMPPMDAASQAALEEAMEGAPYTAPVKREWEV
jgi:radical SAM protein with 4Fe4S-binding SPASM domain